MFISYYLLCSKDLAQWQQKMVIEGHLDMLPKKKINEIQKNSETKTPTKNNKK